MTTNGLDALYAANDAAKQRSARTLAPPRHPRKAPPSAPATKTTKAPPATPRSDAPGDQEPPSIEPPPSPTFTTGSTIARSVQLDELSEDLLDQVRTAGRRQRVDANRSATIRLALRHLAAHLTPEQIAAELKATAPQTASAGRRAL